MNITLFTPCQNKFSRYVSSKLEHDFLYLLIYKIIPKMSQKYYFLIHFWTYLCVFFYVFLVLNQWYWSVYNEKIHAENLPKYREFMPKICQNIGNFPYFYKMRGISKSRRIRFLKLGMSILAEHWTCYSLLIISAWFAHFYVIVCVFLT